ncbi:MAG: hypothetical protein LBH24_06905 [Clostridiales bacterium]|jgi:hypothetical protein|nr:hypothetical protein [Clostridiales bacterium]
MSGIEVTEMPDNVYLTVRESARALYAFVVNMAQDRREFLPRFSGRDIPTDREVSGKTTLRPMEVLIVAY